ncbi:agmatinase family protein [Paenibacillus sp. GCM10012307]|uniref:Agmatinase family protein n=1 Tax=Paenibacillus roseus TaxID=2798579 RepID=A0A934J102_9BACL|nr:agmatinase family protein [Paenibacillus roseus]MBJ6362836.1 agmatinase family protein [Paenibacillus roseus]
MEINKTKVVNDITVKWLADHWSPIDLFKDLSFGFLSVPFDYAVSHRPGTRIGPQTILETLNSYSLYLSDKRVSLEDATLTDLGSVDIVHDMNQSYRNIEYAASTVPENYTPIFLGGDHSITDPIIRGMNKRIGSDSLGIIMFDTHFDFRDPIPGKEHSGHWLKTLEDEIDYNSLAIIGISAPIYSAAYMDELERRGALIKTVYDFRRQGRDAVLNEVTNHVLKHTDGIYFTIDIDSIDQGFAPGCSVPNPNGLFPHEIMDSVFEIASTCPVYGMDIVEVSPWLDNAQNFTSHIASHIIMNFIAGNIKRNQY